MTTGIMSAGTRISNHTYTHTPSTSVENRSDLAESSPVCHKKKSKQHGTAKRKEKKTGQRTPDNQIWSQDTRSNDANTRLCGSVTGSEAGEYDGGSAPHGTEEGLLFASVKVRAHVINYSMATRMRVEQSIG